MSQNVKTRRRSVGRRDKACLKGRCCMSNAKQIIINQLSIIPDDIQDEFEVLENLYKLLRLERSRQSVEENGSYSTDEVRQYFQKKHTDIPFESKQKSGVLA